MQPIQTSLTGVLPLQPPISSPGKPRWILVVGPRSLNTLLLQAIARLGEYGPVRVLDGGNRFNAYVVARAAGGQPHILNRITASRAFTCYQVLSLLESTPAIQVPSAAEPAGSSALVVLDLLNTFYDESVQPAERKRLLQRCLLQLERLARTAEGLISIHPPAIPSPAAVELLHMLQSLPFLEPHFIDPEPPAPEPWRLF